MCYFVISDEKDVINWGMPKGFWGFWSPKKGRKVAIFVQIWSNFELKKVHFSLQRTFTFGNSPVKEQEMCEEQRNHENVLQYFLNGLIITH